MNRDQLYDFFDSYTDQAKRLSQAKNEDYAASEDPFMNFKQCGEIGIITRMTDKVTRLKNLIFSEFKTGKSNPAVDESIEDTLMDLFNYAWLLAAFREAKGCDAADQAFIDDPPTIDDPPANPMIEAMVGAVPPLTTMSEMVVGPPDMDPGDCIDSSELTPPPAVELDYDIEAFTAALGRYIDGDCTLRPMPSDFPSGGDIEYCLSCGDLTCICGCGFCDPCGETRS